MEAALLATQCIYCGQSAERECALSLSIGRRVAGACSPIPLADRKTAIRVPNRMITCSDWHSLMVDHDRVKKGEQPPWIVSDELWERIEP
ncbi:hypothetical protein, partial [Saccharopolyspora elongata]|uniref:hypothetical protein n=1 Tax=Saccharopolyspora elongata TaxID=2530387 RepID=UPI001A9CE323